MMLTFKTAGLTCLSFIGALVYLVNLVPRPIDEQSTPLVKRGGAGAAQAYAGARTRTDGMEGRFARLSAVDDVERTAPASEVVFVAANDVFTKLKGDLPPAYIPAAPVVHREMLPIESPPEPAAYAGAEDQYDFEASIPEATAAESGANRPRMLAALRPEEPGACDEPLDDSSCQQYTVKPGDSLHRIMQRHWKRVDARAKAAFLAANPELAGREHKIFPGEILNIPSPDASPSGVRLVGHVENSRRGAAGATTGVGYSWYTVKQKDSLASIARRFLNDSERWREIATLNRIKNVDRILPGSRLKLPPPSTDT